MMASGRKGIQATLQQAKQRVTGTFVEVAVLRLILAVDYLLIRIFARRNTNSSNLHIILNSPGAGNIGDQAMFESFVKNMPGKVVAIVTSAHAYSLPSDIAADKVQWLVAPRLVYSKSFGHLCDVFRLSRIIRSASSFSVMGADIMDGGYGLHSSMVEWNLARSIQECGIPSQILGFSWNGRVPQPIVEQARHAGLAGVTILARDPDSYDRLIRDGISGVQQTSDLVFSFIEDQTQNLPPEIINIHRSGKSLAVVNVSGLIGLKTEQESEYDEFLRALTERGHDIVLLPHVSHSNVSDLDAISKLRSVSRYARAAVAIDRLLTPSEIAKVVKEADLVVTGRMHLSILSLRCGTPVIVLATQGKVSGLMKLFGTPDYCVDPVPGFGRRIAEIIAAWDSEREQVLRTISVNLPNVKQLSTQNFKPAERGQTTLESTFSY